MTEKEDRPVLNVEGEKVALGPLRRDPIPAYTRWVNDLRAFGNLGGFLPTTTEGEKQWYESVATSDFSVTFTVYALPELRPVGTTSLFKLDHRNRAAEFGILIGEPGHRNRGLGTETTRLVLDYAFTVIGLHNVMLRVFGHNRAGIRAYEKAGFKEFGRRRQSHLMGGKVWDEIHMDCLSTEFESPMLAKTFASDHRTYKA